MNEQIHVLMKPLRFVSRLVGRDLVNSDEYWNNFRNLSALAISSVNRPVAVPGKPPSLTVELCKIISLQNHRHLLKILIMFLRLYIISFIIYDELFLIIKFTRLDITCSTRPSLTEALSNAIGTQLIQVSVYSLGYTSQLINGYSLLFGQHQTEVTQLI